MRDLKKGDKFTRPDFTSFSFDVPRRINSQNQGAVYSSLLPKGVIFSYWILLATERVRMYRLGLE
jgi:hypothetical protein